MSDKATDAHLGRAPRSEAEADAMAAAVWAAMWPVQRLRQREFFEFGMEVRVGLLRGVGGALAAVSIGLLAVAGPGRRPVAGCEI